MNVFDGDISIFSGDFCFLAVSGESIGDILDTLCRLAVIGENIEEFLDKLGLLTVVTGEAIGDILAMLCRLNDTGELAGDGLVVVLCLGLVWGEPAAAAAPPPPVSKGILVFNLGLSSEVRGSLATDLADFII